MVYLRYCCSKLTSLLRVGLPSFSRVSICRPEHTAMSRRALTCSSCSRLTCLTTPACWLLTTPRPCAEWPIRADEAWSWLALIGHFPQGRNQNWLLRSRYLTTQKERNRHSEVRECNEYSPAYFTYCGLEVLVLYFDWISSGIFKRPLHNSLANNVTFRQYFY